MYNVQKLSRIENGQLPDIHALRAMLDMYGAKGWNYQAKLIPGLFQSEDTPVPRDGDRFCTSSTSLGPSLRSAQPNPRSGSEGSQQKGRPRVLPNVMILVVLDTPGPLTNKTSLVIGCLIRAWFKVAAICGDFENN
ncbi:hypothetical protein SK854_18280 [Lentzea sp. BCCO 10_0061]|uniref:DUF4177 domain-containing protein n=1 Tax=Lentzea sokolovensis TaxID=3095429 RepID=A0ABU4UX39_9PSEU|nr:hypothetical protein [Lentzea sp. BCCO 10_0061]MDX8144072.1 hypothetical protein [Lentzea sp. BCCO 10_0061]